MSDWFDKTKKNIQENATENSEGVPVRSAHDEKIIETLGATLRVFGEYLKENYNRVAADLFDCFDHSEDE